MPVLVLVLGCTVLAYLAGAAGLSRLGAGVGSVVSLSEVLFAVLAAWLLLGQQPTGGQLAAARSSSSGVALARTGGARRRPLPRATARSRPDAAPDAQPCRTADAGVVAARRGRPSPPHAAAARTSTSDPVANDHPRSKA